MLKQFVWIEVVNVRVLLGCKIVVCLYIYKANQMPKAGNKGFTFSLVIEDHARFKLETIKNSDDMSILVNRFINSYSDASERARAKNTLKND